MTIEQAIIHAEEVADRCAVTDGNRQCEDEHRQLAAWLRELQERRQKDNKIGRGNAIWLINSDGYYPYCSACMTEPKDGIMTDFCPSCGAKMEGKIT